MFPVHRSIENLFYHKKEKVWWRTALVYGIRFSWVVITVYLTVTVNDKIDKVLSLAGAILCGPIVFMIPAMIHQKLVATSKIERIENWIYIFASCGILVFCTVQDIMDW